ncbi:AraC family transcriptional regulator [Chelatococcus reniformis]|uniref:AraC family transcriptional regulator n=1 Tax=Chelatococcus reniformis TaxID=1494448 RepID=A0A916XIF1_9HYPH|nr:AraC family transcriptional regulator [Chelatococcus reniformis]
MPFALADSRGEPSGSPPALQWTTAAVAPRDRFAYWRDEVMRRNEPVAQLEHDRPFDAHLRIINANGIQLLEHVSSSIAGERSAARCAADGVDDIVFDLMVGARHGTLDHAGRSLPHRAGDLCIIDQAQPSSLVRSRHRAVALVLPRMMVTRALGRDPDHLAGLTLPAKGIGALLRAHMIATMVHEAELSERQRVVALTAAADMALAQLQAEAVGGSEPDGFESGHYAAARQLIERRCADAALSPDMVARAIGCSRASLYRAFARRGETIAAVIWDCRLTRAWQLLTTRPLDGLKVAEIAFRCGFLDAPTFNRMFKRRFGMTPSDAREQHLADQRARHGAV